MFLILEIFYHLSVRNARNDFFRITPKRTLRVQLVVILENI